jgi:hypothetical protein
MRVIFLFVFVALLLVSCGNSNTSDPQKIVDKAIAAAGGDKFSDLLVDFDFRDKHYRGMRNNGSFQLERHFSDSLGRVTDVYTNDNFVRFINDEVANIPDSMAFKYQNSVNSVHYFALLPYGLNDPAVNKYYLGETEINSKTYLKVRITFDEKDGGKDFEDVFVYWFDKETYNLDYLAYSYITDGGGMRFREAYNERIIGGIRFLDYHNYKPLDKTMDPAIADSLFLSKQLKLLSSIELKNIQVK